MNRTTLRAVAVFAAAIMTGCWLLCSTESEMTHQDPDSQPCISCAMHHSALPASGSAVTVRLNAPGRHEALLESTPASQGVIRLIVPPPKQSA